eukprot:1180401-Prorocentrum_minimum.AAC.2
MEEIAPGRDFYWLVQEQLMGIRNASNVNSIFELLVVPRLRPSGLPEVLYIKGRIYGGLRTGGSRIQDQEKRSHWSDIAGPL